MMNPDICNIHPQIRIYVYALADPRRSAGSDWIWTRTPRCSPPRGAARVPDFKTLRWLDHHLWKEDPDPRNLASCLNTPIWDGIRIQTPTEVRIQILCCKHKNYYFLCCKNPGSLFWARKKPLRARSHTLSIFDT